MRLAVRGIERGEIDALLRFYAEQYGRGSYQSSLRYFDWLYAQNPATRGIEDCLVALEEGTIVGCVHRMRLPCMTDTGATTLASLQNHVVSPRLRGGAGIMLLQKAVKGERIALSPGVQGRLREAYRRLGYDELPSYWLLRVLSPLKAAAQSAARSLTRGRFPSSQLCLSARQAGKSAVGALTVTLSPSAEQVARLAAGLEAQAGAEGGAHVPWDADLLRWRYFSPAGPRHVLIEKPPSGAWAVLSYGLRSRVNVARLVEYEAAGDGRFMRDVLGVARRVGASVALAYTTRSMVKDQLTAAGWRSRADPPSSFTKGVARLSISAAATDVGFEALLTETPA